VRGPPAFAYAYGRVRARHSRLLGPEDAVTLRAGVAPGAVLPTLAVVGLAPGPPAQACAAVFARLVCDYAALLKCLPAGHDLLRALLGLHEVENLKLAWRGLSRRLPFERWRAPWRDLRGLETLRRDTLREASSLRELAAALRGSPYGEAADSILRAHEDDPLAAEVALDRWASRRLLEEARRLPRRDGDAAALAVALVRERDLDVVRRAEAWYGLAPSLVAAATALLQGEIGRAAVERLAEWTPTAGPLAVRLPAALARAVGPVADWDALQSALRRNRRRACARAMRRAPFSLGPAVAFLLLREEEVRALAAFVEHARAPHAAAVLDRLLAATAMVA
jgi:hypothetical protein